jgi:hypothetical protein
MAEHGIKAVQGIPYLFVYSMVQQNDQNMNNHCISTTGAFHVMA